MDRDYLSRNICSVCTRLLEKSEVKLVMPSRMYSSYFFDRLPLENRLMCTSCYAKARKLNLIRNPLVKIGQIRVRITRKLARKAVMESKAV